MRRLGVIVAVLSAILFVGCKKSPTVEHIQLNSQADSISYALGVHYGTEVFKAWGWDSIPNSIQDTIFKALETGEQQTDTLDEWSRIGRNIGLAIANAQQTGIADNEAWACSERVFYCGLLSGLQEDTTHMQPDEAQEYLYAAYERSGKLHHHAKGASRYTCPKEIEKLYLSPKTNKDSVNFAFGYQLGRKIAEQMDDSTLVFGTLRMVNQINRYRNQNRRNPVILHHVEDIGMHLAQHDTISLRGGSYPLQRELFKQGFKDALAQNTRLHPEVILQEIQ